MMPKTLTRTMTCWAISAGWSYLKEHEREHSSCTSWLP
jgi:hypothetical protein